MASTQLCISQAETDDRDRTDNSFECFKSPTPSLSRSPRTPRYSSERFAIKGSVQETERGGLYSSTSQFIGHHYIIGEDTEQGRRGIAGSVVVAGTGGVLRQYERSSSQGSVNYQLDIIEGTVASGHTTGSRIAMHTGETTGGHSPPSYEQIQLSSSAELTQRDNSVGRVSGALYFTGRGQNQSPSFHRVSEKRTNEQSFYAPEQHSTGYGKVTSIDPPKRTITCEEEGVSEGINHCVPDV